MEEEKQEVKESMEEKVDKEVEKFVNRILEQGIQPTNVDNLYKVIDIHKDLANIKYWDKKKEEIDMRYKAYSEGSMSGRGSMGAYSAGGSMGAYGRGSEGDFKHGAYEKREYEEAMGEGGSYGRRGVPGSGRGGYSAGGSYGRRGVKGTGRGRYRGEEMIEEMFQGYQGYSEGKEEQEFGAGSYRGKEETIKHLEYMMECIAVFVAMLEEEVNSQEEFNVIKKFKKKISEM